MLIEEPSVLSPDPFLFLVSSLAGRPVQTREVEKGIYKIGHFGSTHFLPEYEHYPELSINSYGVCDNHDQILQKCPELQDENRKFVITLTEVNKSDQPESGGWRWHKWGPYIGEQDPQCEYIYDEPEIESVLIYHIYEKE